MTTPPSVRVGIIGTSYVIERVISSLPFERVQIVPTYDLMHILNVMQQRLMRRNRATGFTNCFHCDLGLNNVDILHFFNTISGSSTPWIVSYEHFLPRWNPSSHFGFRLLAQHPCRKILAMSQFAHDQMSELIQHNPLRDDILPKMSIVHPAQPLLIGSVREKPVNPGPTVFTLVGRDFFRKGGLEVLRAFTRLHNEHIPFDLNLVTVFAYGDYASLATRDHLGEAQRLITGLGNSASVHEEIHNAAVLDLLRASHVGLLPTYDDTYGFSVLESQAAGCPVITTGVCVMSEINNSDVGWVIPVPQDDRKIALRSSDRQRRELSAAIEEGVYQAALEAINTPALVTAKAERALVRIASEHDPVRVAHQMEELYHNA